LAKNNVTYFMDGPKPAHPEFTNVAPISIMFTTFSSYASPMTDANRESLNSYSWTFYVSILAIIH